MTQKAQSEIRRLTGYALCRRLRLVLSKKGIKMKTELQLADVARLLFCALGKYATETEKEAARLAFFVFSEQQAKKNSELRKTCETAFDAVKTAGVYHGAKDAGH